MVVDIAGDVPIRDLQNKKRRPVGAALKNKVSSGQAGGNSALRELEALAGTGLAGLLALFLARVALDVAGLLQGGT